MNKHIKYAMKLHWNEVASIIDDVITSQLGRKVNCTAKSEDFNYWSASAADGDTFTVGELKTLLKFINADLTTCHDCLPPDSDTSKSIGMPVSETLLGIGLETTWEHVSICREGLWIVGIEDISMLSKYIAKRGVDNDD